MRAPSLLLLLSLPLAACGGKAAPPVAPSNGGGGAPAADPQAIRTIDFKNFTYGDGENATTVVDGTVEIPVPDAPDIQTSFTVLDVTYGDLDGDGREEAVITTEYWGGGTGHFTEALVYSLPAGATAAVALGSIPGGDRGDGGLDGVKVEGGVVMVDRLKSLEEDGSCCPSHVVHEQWKWNGKEFVEDQARRVEAAFGE